jgi:hypothetical protein
MDRTGTLKSVDKERSQFLMFVLTLGKEWRVDVCIMVPRVNPSSRGVWIIDW